MRRAIAAGSSSAALFKGWEGGNGPTDCEFLYRRFVTGRRYGAFLTFGLNDTYPRKLKAQTGDSP